MCHASSFSLLNTPLAMPFDQVRMLAAQLPVEDVAPIVHVSPTRMACAVIQGVAVIPVTGLLVPKLGVLGPVAVDRLGILTGCDGIRAMPALALRDESVHAVVLDIDSNGGMIASSLDLADAIRQARGAKPMWAILSENACGAAYALASACDVITVPRSGCTGGVGIVVAHVNFSQALSQAGIAVTLVASGSRKTDGNEFEPLRRSVRNRIQADVDRLGEMLVATVAGGRGMSRHQVRRTQGLTYHVSEG